MEFTDMMVMVMAEPVSGVEKDVVVKARS